MNTSITEPGLANPRRVRLPPKTDADKHNWPLQRGFDRFYGTIHGAGSFFDPNTLVRDNRFISPYADPEYQPAGYYYTDAINDHAARFVTEHRERGEVVLRHGARHVLLIGVGADREDVLGHHVREPGRRRREAERSLAESLPWWSALEGVSGRRAG